MSRDFTLAAGDSSSPNDSEVRDGCIFRSGGSMRATLRNMRSCGNCGGNPGPSASIRRGSQGPYRILYGNWRSQVADHIPAGTALLYLRITPGRRKWVQSCGDGRSREVSRITGGSPKVNSISIGSLNEARGLCEPSAFRTFSRCEFFTPGLGDVFTWEVFLCGTTTASWLTLGAYFPLVIARFSSYLLWACPLRGT